MQNADFNSDNTDSNNKDNRNRTTTNINTNSDTNNKNFLSSDNNIEKNTVTRDESNTSFNAFIKNEVRIACTVE